MWKWKGGVHYLNEGHHNHPRPTHLLHLTAKEHVQWEKIVYDNPGERPLQLIVGPRTGSGHGKSVAEILSVLTNRDRVGKELQQVRHGQGAVASLKEFEEFATNHPGFVIHSCLGEVVVICLQTDWMRSQALAFDTGVETSRDVDDPVSGTLSDAAHGWWRDRNRLLVVSSVFSPTADRWVPVLFSYTNGATSKHYKEHFLALLKTIAKCAEDEGVELDDKLFASVSQSS